MLSICGSVLLITVTSHGIGLTADSAFYVAGARNIAAGNGYQYLDPAGVYTPILVWPPGYSTVLAIPTLCGWDTLIAARYVAAAIFALNIFLVGWVVRQLAPGQWWSAPLASLLCLSSTDILDIHSRACSEPLFIMLVITGLFALSTAYVREDRWSLFLASIVLGLAALTRLGGVAFIAAGAIVTLADRRKQWRESVCRLVIYCLGAGLPLLGWIIRNELSAASTFGRGYGLYTIGTARWHSLWVAVSAWIIPESLPAVTRNSLIAVVLVGITLSVIYLRRPEGSIAQASTQCAASFSRLAVVSVVMYFGLLFTTMKFVDPQLPFSRRIMVPVFVVAVLLVIPMISRLYDFMDTRRRKFVALLCISIVLLFGVRAIAWYNIRFGNSLGFASQRYQQSETLVRAHQLIRDGHLVFTNSPCAMYFYSGTWVRYLPDRWNSGRQQVDPDFIDKLRQTEDMLRKEHGVVVWLYEPRGNALMLTYKELQKLMPLSVVYDAEDGVICELSANPDTRSEARRGEAIKNKEVPQAPMPAKHP